jgi:hypothetical protein
MGIVEADPLRIGFEFRLAFCRVTGVVKPTPDCVVASKTVY